MTMRIGVLTVSVFVLIGSAAVASDDWPQFRGPGGNGHSDSIGVPLDWSETEGGRTENIAWKAAAPGRGWSSPVVLGDQIWLTTALETPATPEEAAAAIAGVGMSVPSPQVARRVVLKTLCFGRATGKLLHDVVLFDVDRPPPICSVNSFASPTPVVEPGRLYCDFGAMGTVCVDTSDGKILWRRRLPIEHQVGPGSSPALHGDLLILVRDGCDVQYITALDKKTGRTVWKTDRPPIKSRFSPFKKAFSTPLVIDTGRRSQMIVPGAQWIVSYNPADGSPIWRVDTGSTFSNTSRPVFGHGMVYVCTAFGGSQLLAVRVSGRGEVTDTHVAWILRKQVPKRSSPLLVGDELYVVSDGGVATCLDARTGHIHWTERLSGDCSASPLYAGGRIYFFTEDGTTTVMRPGTQPVKLAENTVQGRIMASAAVADRAIFLRTDKHLYRIEKRGG